MRSWGTFAGSILLLLAPAAGATPAEDSYRVGPGDVLEVTVEGRPDLSRLPTVQTTGAVFLPRAGEVRVAGMEPEEIAEEIASRLSGPDLPEPRVTVSVKEFHSKFVWVYGEVRRPGRKPLRSGTRLVDALLDAGGFTPQASGEVKIERREGTFPDGRPSLVMRFSGGSPTAEEIRHLELLLVNGDLVLAVTQHWVTVSGEVARPGRYPLDEGMTLQGLLANAGGLTPFASNTITVRRSTGAAGPTDIEVDLKGVRDGTTVDPALAPGDHVVVRSRRL